MTTMASADMTGPLVACITDVAKALCAKPEPRFVPQCAWTDFFDADKHQEILTLVQSGSVLDQTLHGLCALYDLPELQSCGDTHPFILSPTESTNGWSTAASNTIQCAISAGWPNDPAERLTPEYLPRLETEFKSIFQLCPPQTELKVHLECILTILNVLQTPLDTTTTHTKLVEIAGKALASNLPQVHAAAQRAAFSAKALEYASDVDLGEARFEIAAKLDPDEPSQYSRRAAQASIFIQMPEPEKQALRSIVVDLPKSIYKQVEDARGICCAENSKPGSHAELAELLRATINYRSSPFSSNMFSF